MTDLIYKYTLASCLLYDCTLHHTTHPALAAIAKTETNRDYTQTALIIQSNEWE